MRENREKYMNIRITEKEKEIITEKAKALGMTKSDLGRKALYRLIPELREKGK